MMVLFIPLFNLHAEEGSIDSIALKADIGIGIPELMHIGGYMKRGDADIGVIVGTFPFQEASTYSVSTVFLMHLFGGLNEAKNKPWIADLGISYVHDETAYEINKYAYVHCRWGYEYALSQTLCVQASAGIMFEVVHEEIEKKPSPSWFDFDFEFPVLPSLRINTVYSF